jgi:hypothetical protein
MAFRKLLLVGAVAASAVVSTAARAEIVTGAFSFAVVTGDTNGAGFATLPGASPFTGPTAAAKFTYTGALNFNNPAAQNSGSSGDLNSTFFTSAGGSISNYTGVGTFAGGNDNYGTLAGFLAGSGSASNFAYGSFYRIDLGVLDAGTILTITHDDGASLFQGATQLGSTVAGPTSVVTDVVDITTTGDTTLFYSRQNGSPSILEVSAVPEASTWAMMILGFFGVGFTAYRKRTTVRFV